MEQHSLLACAARHNFTGHLQLGHGMWPPWPSLLPAVLCGSPSGLGHVFPVRGALGVTACTQTWALALGWALRCHLRIPKTPGGSEHPWGQQPYDGSEDSPSLPMCSSLSGSSRTPGTLQPPGEGGGTAGLELRAPNPPCHPCLPECFPRALTRGFGSCFHSCAAPGPLCGRLENVVTRKRCQHPLPPCRGFGTTPGTCKLWDPKPPECVSTVRTPLFPRGWLGGVHEVPLSPSPAARQPLTPPCSSPTSDPQHGR